MIRITVKNVQWLFYPLASSQKAMTTIFDLPRFELHRLIRIQRDNWTEELPNLTKFPLKRASVDKNGNLILGFDDGNSRRSNYQFYLSDDLSHEVLRDRKKAESLNGIHRLVWKIVEQLKTREE